MIIKWEKQEGKKCLWVSGLTIFESGSSEEGGVKSVFLSETRKAWSHQPLGGKRNPHEGPVAAILREFGEEAGWENAPQLLRAFQRGKVEYMGFYIPKAMSAKSNPLCVQRFALSKDFIDTSAIKSGSDNEKGIWADKDFFASTKVSGTAEAERAWKQIYGFSRPKKSGGEVDLSEGNYDGVPDSLRDIINAELSREKLQRQSEDT